MNCRSIARDNCLHLQNAAILQSMTDISETLPPIEIPLTSLSAEAQEGVIDDFISREGTDYGWNETSHEKKHAQILAQIQAGQVKLVFDPNEESVTLMTLQDWQRQLGR